ncbi:hypothetical protein P9X10_00340 [Bacillus cereus]|nr:hypothetical protein [Bacillus cereus]
MTYKEIIIQKLAMYHNQLIKLGNLEELRLEAVETDKENINIEYMMKKGAETDRVVDMYRENRLKIYTSYKAVLELAVEMGFSEVDLKHASKKKVEELIKSDK